MTFNEFLESNIEVYELTQNEWVEIHNNHMMECWKITQQQSNIKFNDINKRLERETIEAKCFHKAQVESALKNGLEVSKTVLKDYEGLNEQIKERQRKAIEKENSRILLTYDMIKDIKANTKLVIDGYKVTLKEIKEDCIICKPYKTRNKTWKVSLNCKISKFAIGWN